MKKLLLIILVGCFFYGCQSGGNYSSTDSLNVDTNSALYGNIKDSLSKSVENKKLSNNWIYSQNEDKMTSRITYTASIDAKDELDFPFPYNGGSVARILVRHKRGENDVLLMVSKGQFNSNIVDGATVKVRFDHEKAKTYSCASPSDGSTEAIFINSSNKFIQKLKKVKRVLIEAEFYNNGLKQMEFNVHGFKWNH